MTTKAIPEPGYVYGLQAASWYSGEIIEGGMTKIGSTRRTVDARVAEMQKALGAGGVHKLVVAFAVPVTYLRVEQAVHVTLKAEGRHISAGSATEWFAIDPEEARKLVADFATGERDLETALSSSRPTATSRRNRSSINGKKEVRMTPRRAAALTAVRAAVTEGGLPSTFQGGQWGAAATALAVEEAISKSAALVLMREWFVVRDKGEVGAEQP